MSFATTTTWNPGWGVFAALLFAAGGASAQAAITPQGEPAEPPRQLSWHAAPEAQPPGASDQAPLVRRHAQERPFAFVLDPSTPSSGDVSLGYDLGSASRGPAERPLPSSIGVTGVSQALTLDYGWSERVAPFVSVRVLTPARGSERGGAGGAAGVRWQLTDPRSHFRLTLAAVGFREIEGSWGTYARIAASYDLDRLRIASNLHAEKVFAPGRDAVDVLVLAGLSYRLMGEMRVGVEYVGQDLEETFDSEGGAEGGARHYVGPSLALNLLSDNLQLVAGAGMGLQSRGSGVMGRLGALVTF